MVLQMPLGIVYFTLNITLITLGLSMIVGPFVQIFWHFPIIATYNGHIFLSTWALVLMEIGGFSLLTLAMHLARLIGGLHGRYAKWMLVS
jgi:hypothetical protein